MRLNNKTLFVAGPYDNTILYTPKDLIWGVSNELTHYNNLVQLICIKEMEDPSVGVTAEYFTPMLTDAFVNAIRSYSEFLTKDSNTLVAKDALTEILHHLIGEGYNSNGTIKILPDGTDLNSYFKNGRWEINQSFSYLNLPIILGDYDKILFESKYVSESGIGYQSLLCIKENPEDSVIVSRQYNDSQWADWATYQQYQIYNSFTKNYNLLAVQYISSYVTVNALLKTLNGKSVELIYDESVRLPFVYNCVNLPDGYYEVHVIDTVGYSQVVLNFSVEDVEFVKFYKTPLNLSTNNNSVNARLVYVGNSEINIEVSSNSITASIVKIMKLPLKIAENVQ